MKRAIYLLLLLPFALWSSEQQELRRVRAHLLLGDARSAAAQAHVALQLFPHSKPLVKACVEALCACGEACRALELCKQSEALEDRELLEIVAWGVLRSSVDAPQMTLRLSALAAAASTKDARAVPMLLHSLRGSSAPERRLAAELAAQFGDRPIQEELLRLLQEERVWYVRLAVIDAVAELRIRGAEALLQQILIHPRTSAEEMAASMAALAHLADGIDRAELRRLIRSARAGHRQLACELVAHFDDLDACRELLPLLRDSCPGVKVRALYVLGILSVNEQALWEHVEPLLQDPCVEVAIAAGWLAMRLGKDAGKRALKRALQDPHPQMRHLAAGALRTVGAFGTNLARKMLHATDDSYVKVNLALALIAQRSDLALACRTLHAFLLEPQQQLMWASAQGSLFSHIRPSRIRHSGQVPHYPRLIDQFVRLDLLSVLSTLHDPEALEMTKKFLQSQSWGITASAASVLVQEGDEEALGLVRELLGDSDERVRMQAALVLADVGRDPIATQTLIDAYPDVGMERKLQLLEALGRIGDAKSIPFLVQAMQEPFHGLRVAAASALIQCLTH